LFDRLWFITNHRASNWVIYVSQITDKMLSNIDEAFLLSLKNEFVSNSLPTLISPELLSNYSPINTLTSELDCLPTISQGKFSSFYF
jgi:hypothetical protein